MIPDYIDLHCDTAFELYHQKQHLMANDLAISLNAAAVYPHYAQFFAVWTDKRLDDERAYADFLAITDHFAAEVAASDRLSLCRSFEGLATAWNNKKAAAFLAVEDARLLGGRLERLDELAQRGVTYLTLGWSGQSCICSSHDVPSDEDTGLTDFGRATVESCFALGIIPDISHASARTTDEVLMLAEAANKPVIATHSNAYSVYGHTRNLRDEHLRRLIALGGIVGLNLCEFHLRHCPPSTDVHATIDDAIRHIEHYLALGGEHHIVIGGDLDGAPLPEGIKTVGDVIKLADALAAHGYSDTFIQNIFSKNALHFIKHHIGTKETCQ